MNIGKNRPPRNLGAQSEALFGGIQYRKRDRFGELVEEPAVHDAAPPALPKTSRIERIRRASPVELDDCEKAYLEAYDLAEAYRDHLDQIRDAIGDVESGRSEWR